MKIPLDPNEPHSMEVVRQIVLKRLREDQSWQQLDLTGAGFDQYVEYVGAKNPRRLSFLALEICWELIIQGVLMPGLNPENPNLPWFHITEYGKQVFEAGEFIPHDPESYLQKLKDTIRSLDQTVFSYVAESLNCFTRGTHIAATIVLGIAAERVFQLVCESLQAALKRSSERDEFKKILSRNAMKPKLDWVLKKTELIRERDPRALPDNVNVMLSTVYDFIRCQRNELGHPREQPPKLTRGETFVNLHIFPRYYAVAEQVRTYLSTHKV